MRFRPLAIQMNSCPAMLVHTSCQIRYSFHRKLQLEPRQPATWLEQWSHTDGRDTDCNRTAISHVGGGVCLRGVLLLFMGGQNDKRSARSARDCGGTASGKRGAGINDPASGPAYHRPIRASADC